MSSAPPVDAEWIVEWPTLGFLAADWVERHCIVPDGFRKGQPFEMYRWQLWCTTNHYRVRPDALPAGDEKPDGSFVSVASAFHYRRSQVVAPQKAGKGPWSATIVALNAVGPATFYGWATKGDAYVCSDWGCPCGWVWDYEPGDPMGRPWPTPLIQLTATSQDQVDNVYRPLRAMARAAGLAPLMQVTEEFIRCPNDGRIDVVSSSALSRLGQPLTDLLHDESGTYTKRNGMVEVARTQRRGVAGMGGRSLETTNAWDSTQESTAQQTARAAETQPDIFRYHREPPKALGDYKRKADRRRIHAFAYADSPHIDLDAIEAEAAELLLEDPRNAERFFGNRNVAGSDKWTTVEEWDARIADPAIDVAKGETIVLGFDGSAGSGNRRRVADSTVLVGCRVSDGHVFHVASWEQPDDVEEWEVPRDEVDAKLVWAFGFYDVAILGYDPPYWRTEGAEWTERWGEDRVMRFETKHDQLMSGALERLRTGLRLGGLTHDSNPVLRKHATNAVTRVKEFRDDTGERKRLVLVEKTTKDSPDKIDGLVSAAIAFDMRARAIAAGVRKRKKFKAVAFD